MKRTWTIYALIDPDRQIVRYVGFTFGSLNERLRRHISDAPRTSNRKSAWIRGLLRRKLRPGIVALQVGSGPRHCAAEKFWIALFGAAGTELVNSKTGPKGKAHCK